ncbi:paraquat-inducible protein A [Aureococcus anophagefferens]|nr:paraquat-inducible protein A [Aureococcus anophagefferens]
MLRLVAIACLAAGAAALSARPTASARTNLLQVLAREIPVPERFTASVAGQSSIEEAVANLEKAASKDDLPSFPRDLMLIDGEWTLKYTNNAPPPPPDWAPSAAGRLAGRDVVQRIDVMNRRVVNCVTLNPWPVGDDVPGGEFLERLPLVGGPIAALAKASVRLELDHAFTVEGDGSDGGPRRAAGTNRLKIALERVERTLSDLDESASPLFATFLPTFSEVDVPEPVRAANAALAATALGGGLFDTTYCDDTIRVSRGTNPLLRELRVFVKADAQIDADDALVGAVVVVAAMFTAGEEAASLLADDSRPIADYGAQSPAAAPSHARTRRYAAGALCALATAFAARPALAWEAANEYTARLGAIAREYPWQGADFQVVDCLKPFSLALTVDHRAQETVAWSLEAPDRKVSTYYGPRAEGLVLDAVGDYALRVTSVSVDGVVAASGGGTVAVRYVRRELRDLSEADRTTWLDALALMWTVDGDEGRKKYDAP